MPIVLVNPPTVSDFEGLGNEHLSYFEIERQILGPDGVTSLPGEHLGLGLLTARLRQRGFEVEVVNGQANEDRSVAATWQRIVDQVGSATPELVGFSCPVQVLHEALWLAARCKETWPNVVVAFGHDFPSLNARQVLEKYAVVDVVVVGDGEDSVCELAGALIEGRPIDQIAGLTIRGEDGVISTGPRQLTSFDELPWPDRGDLPAVRAAGLAIGVYTARGCPYRCSYCTTGAVSALTGQSKQRLRSIEDVLDEISMLVTDHGVEHVTITDDLFLTKHPASQQRAVEFATGLLSRGLDITFMVDCRIDSIQRDTFDVLRRAGLTRIFVGIETPSDRQLKFYNKRYKGGHDPFGFIRDQLAVVDELGIQILPGILTYHPTVTMDELATTWELIQICKSPNAGQYLKEIEAYPGTPLYRAYAEAGYLTADWPDTKWSFADPAVAAHHAEMLRTAQRTDFDLATLRTTFRKLLNEAERESTRENRAS